MSSSLHVSKPDSLYLGIDMGGTNIRFALVDTHGHIHSSESRPLALDREARIHGPVEILQEFESQIAGIGVAIAGTFTGGLLDWSANLGLHSVDFGSLLAEHTTKPISLLNDARAAGLAEALVGGGVGAHSVLSVTVGTGIGGALIVDGKLLLGTGDAGEIGHMVVDPTGPDCNCGRNGCWERLVGGRALAEQATLLYPSSADPLSELLQNISDGHESAAAILNRAAQLFALGIDNLCAVLAPDAIVLGGGVMARNGAVARAYRDAIRHTRWGTQSQVRHSALGDTAGQIGAALSAGLIS